MNLRIDPVTATVRFYRDPVDTSAALSDIKEPYYKTLTLLFLDNGEVRITDCVDPPTRKEAKNLYNKLAALGYKRASWRHGNKDIEFSL